MPESNIDDAYLIRLQQSGEKTSAELTAIEVLMLEKFRMSIRLGHSSGHWAVRDGKVVDLGIEMKSDLDLLKRIQTKKGTNDP